MINARRAALLGLTVPLSPIMIALLGLWPEPDTEPPVIDDPRALDIIVSGTLPATPAVRDERKARRRKRMQEVIAATIAALSAQGVLT